jgi:hypothetical protein
MFLTSIERDWRKVGSHEHPLPAEMQVLREKMLICGLEPALLSSRARAVSQDNVDLRFQ